MNKLNERCFDASFTGSPAGAIVGVPKFRAPLIVGEVVEAHVQPGVLLHLTKVRTRLAEPLPEWLESLEGLEATMQDRATAARGVFWAQGAGGASGYPARPNADTPLKWWDSFRGAPSHGERITEATLFAEVLRLLDAATFTLEQVKTFAEHPQILAALRTGAVDHLDAWLVRMTATPAAEFLLNAAQQETVPGFTMKMLGKGRPAFLECLARLVQEANAADVVACVKAIKEGMAS